MDILLLASSFMFAAIGLFAEILKLVRRKEFTLSAIVRLLLIFTYGILPFIVVFAYSFCEISISTWNYKYDYSSEGLFRTWIWQLQGIVVYLVISYCTRRNKKRLANVGNSSVDYSILQFTTYTCFIIGIASLYLWSRAYGGVFNLISVAAAVRSGLSSVNNGIAFFKHPARLVLLTSFSSLLMIKHSFCKVQNGIIFTLSVAFSVLFLLANDGRLSFLLYFIVIIFITFSVFDGRQFSGKHVIFLMAIGVFGMFFVLELDSITSYIRHGIVINASDESFFKSIMDEFAYVMISGQKSTEQALSGTFLIFNDVLNGITAWLPSSLKPFELIDVWDYNTNISTYKFFGQFPCDFVSTAIYDLSYIGPVVFGIFWGSILKKVEKMRCDDSPFKLVCYYALSLRFFRIVDYCSLYDFILGIFSLVVFTIVYVAYKNILKSVTRISS